MCLFHFEINHSVITSVIYIFKLLSVGCSNYTLLFFIFLLKLFTNWLPTLKVSRFRNTKVINEYLQNWLVLVIEIAIHPCRKLEFHVLMLHRSGAQLLFLSSSLFCLIQYRVNERQVLHCIGCQSIASNFRRKSKIYSLNLFSYQK